MFLMNGKSSWQPGCVTKSGHAIGIDPSEVSPGMHEAEWISGGCVIHYKHNLFMKNFYPFKGKAWGEDLIHSFHLQKKGICFWVNTKTICSTRNDPPPKTMTDLFRVEFEMFRARKYYVNLSSRSLVRLYLDFFVRFTRCVFRIPMRLIARKGNIN